MSSPAHTARSDRSERSEAAAPPPGAAPASSACDACLRRSWLLGELSGPLDYCARDRARLLELLALADDELLAAVAGRRTAELRAAYARFDAGVPLPQAKAEGPNGGEANGRASGLVQSICRHQRGYPRSLDGPAAPHMLTVLGGADRLERLTQTPVVAILGSRTPSDYGREVARSLARGLTASGVTIAAALSDGIAAAAHAGALEADGGSLAVLAGGLGVSCSPRRRQLYERVVQAGCAVSELAPVCAGRRWGQRAHERIVVELAVLSVIVEAADTPADLAAAATARELSRHVAAIPGHVTSPLSRGAHALLINGASLVRGPRDVLELLSGIDPVNSDEHPLRHPLRSATHQPADRPTHGAGELARAPAHLQPVLELVRAGYDTPDKLARAGVPSADSLLALSELELRGLLVRGDSGCYLPTELLD